MQAVTSMVVVVVGLLAGSATGLENGLARTPPMGWLAWQRFRCVTDCKSDPYNCISENLFKQIAVRMAHDGYLDAGYNMISLDDCWMASERDDQGLLQPDASRFPSGIAALADYVHSLGLEFGIYEDFGNKTCAGYPGIMGHLEKDANTFASWGVDYVKLDGCYSTSEERDQGYPEFGAFLNKTGRPMVYSCSWPAYNTNPNYTAIIETCNLWRNYNDIQDSWASVSDIIDHYADLQDDLATHAGPGHWNDPDMLVIGNFGLSYDQAKTQMAVWSILAAPLLMSVDLRDMRPEYRDILLNKKVIAVNQDPLGIQGKRISKDGDVELWSRPVQPVLNNTYSYALAIRLREGSVPYKVLITLKDLGMTWSKGYLVDDLFEDKEPSLVMPDSTFNVTVNPYGVVMLRCSLKE